MGASTQLRERARQGHHDSAEGHSRWRSREEDHDTRYEDRDGEAEHEEHDPFSAHA